MQDGTKTILLTFSIAVEISAVASWDADTEEMAVLAIENRLARAIEEELGDQPAHLGWISTRQQELGNAESNSGRCAVCGAWTTDREQPNPIMEIQYGARIEGKLLCDEHLPIGHRWHF